MGEMGDYQLVQRSGQDIGGVMTLGGTPEPAWMPYFAVPSVQRATAAISESGGSVHHGPAEVPGGAHIAIAHDPRVHGSESSARSAPADAQTDPSRRLATRASSAARWVAVNSLTMATHRRAGR
ncbi:MAG: hypothetical protein IPH03_08355 [Tetrasphaera sp.]|nr:hypothetical protein [Tetrasphaera sp.]